MLLNTLIVQTYTPMLKAMSLWLDKAQAPLPADDAQALLLARLAPDMFPLSAQIRFTCVQAYEAVFRLRQEPFPQALTELLTEGHNAADNPGTFADAQARIAQTLAVLDELAATPSDIDPDQPIAHALPIGMIFDLTADQYVRDWTLPQFYFHLMTAYAILRSNNVNIGKADYIPHLFQFIRPGTMPHG